MASRCKACGCVNYYPKNLYCVECSKDKRKQLRSQHPPDDPPFRRVESRDRSILDFGNATVEDDYSEESQDE